MFQMQNSMDSFGMGMLTTVLWCQINHCLSFRPFPLFWTQACPHAKLTGNAHICLPTLRSACWTPGHTLAPVIFGPKQFLYLLAWNLNAHFPHNETWQEKQKFKSREDLPVNNTENKWSHLKPSITTQTVPPADHFLRIPVTALHIFSFCLLFQVFNIHLKMKVVWIYNPTK